MRANYGKRRLANDNSILVDALVLRGLMAGHEPTGRRVLRPNYAVTWPEYLFLAQVVHAVGSSQRAPMLRSIDKAIDLHTGPDHWLPALLDLRRIHDLHGFTVRLVVPDPDASPEVVSAMLAFRLKDREATNLVTAESAGMTLCGTRSTMSAEMERAICLRGVPFLEAQLEQRGWPNIYPMMITDADP